MFYVYMLECSDGSLYTGYTVNLTNRVKTHNQGKGSKYVRSRLPAKLVYHEVLGSKSDAMKREYAIKQLNRASKLKLIQDKVSENVNT